MEEGKVKSLSRRLFLKGKAFSLSRIKEKGTKSFKG
jgi:hypothetical protein